VCAYAEIRALLDSAEVPFRLSFRQPVKPIDQAVLEPEGSYYIEVHDLSRAREVSSWCATWCTLPVQSPKVIAGVRITYMRALFGTLPPCDAFTLTIASPLSACSKVKSPRPTAITNGSAPVDGAPAVDVPPAMDASVTASGGSIAIIASSEANATSSPDAVKYLMLADRGSCRFEEKATNILGAGGSALLVATLSGQPVSLHRRRSLTIRCCSLQYQRTSGCMAGGAHAG
jgi:hypothetical protein